MNRYTCNHMLQDAACSASCPQPPIWPARCCGVPSPAITCLKHCLLTRSLYTLLFVERRAYGWHHDSSEGCWQATGLILCGGELESFLAVQESQKERRLSAGALTEQDNGHGREVEAEEHTSTQPQLGQSGYVLPEQSWRPRKGVQAYAVVGPRLPCQSMAESSSTPWRSIAWASRLHQRGQQGHRRNRPIRWSPTADRKRAKRVG